MGRKTTREAKPGELREIRILETLERLSRRPESRMDLQKLFASFRPPTEKYLKHLLGSGPSSLLSAAKACEMSVKEIEAAIEELEEAIRSIR
jgi:hypothetical protein